MYGFYKKLCTAVFTGIILVFSYLTPCFAEEKDTLTLLSGDVSHNMDDVIPKRELHFNFNHRIDHCDNSFSITGSDVAVTGWDIRGTQLTVILSQKLDYDTQYTLNLAGLSDIYFEEYSSPSISFKTRQVASGTSGGGGGGGKVEKEPEKTEVENSQINAREEFLDISGHWAEAYINDLLSKNIVNGDEYGNFNPDSMIKRSEFIAIAMRAGGFEISDYKDSFTDVKNDSWYADVVQTALKNGIISKDTNFRPDDMVTREEMAKIITLVAKLDDMFGSSGQLSGIYTDHMHVSPWAEDYVWCISQSGLMNGRSDGNFSPGDNATRAEAATVISRMLKIKKM